MTSQAALEGRARHHHESGDYLVDERTGKCWFCRRIVYADGREEVTGQMSFESQAQMKMF